MPLFSSTLELPVPAAEAFAWHERPGAFERLSPPWMPARVLERSGGIRDGGRVVLRAGFGPVSRTWTAVHRDYRAGERFVDEQVSGPFARWVHTHAFAPRGGGASALVDSVDYELPFGPLGVLGRPYARRTLARLFRHRHAVTRSDLERHREAALPPLKLAVTGATGLIGRALVPFLATGGHTVLRLVRRAAGPGEIAWDPMHRALDPEALDGLDAVIHLAGAPISERWTPARKAAIRASRVEGTRLIAEAIARAKSPPKVFLSGSAIGFYGVRGDEPLDESAAGGQGFVADVVREWEAASEPARRAGTRVVNLRTGVVLSPEGGALAKMLLPAKLGAGGPIAGGAQVMSWISLEDELGAILHALATPSLEGPVNLTAPGAVPQREFAKTLGRVLGRPAFAPLPAAVVKALFGEMGVELLVGGQRVVPKKLLDSGFVFRHPTLEAALRFELGREQH